ncbi:MAG: todS [Flavipsychrobacter sp.]|jgi:signal transduction histidine kinase/CheY-like chemotaxis protein|nr:todS [Flavipsychrobacter sp.]
MSAVSNSFAQNQNRALADSLIRKLPDQKDDTHKVKILRKISSLYEYANPEDGLQYALQCLALAEKLDWQKGIANAYDVLGAYSLNKAEFPKALDYYFKALKINEALKDKQATSVVIGNIGTVYTAESNYPKALEYFFKGLAMSTELGDKEGISINMTNIANVYLYQEKFKEALDYDLRALDGYKEVGNKEAMLATVVNIGTIYHYLKDINKELEYFYKGLKINEELGNKLYDASILGNIGNTYLNLAKEKTENRAANLEKAIDHLKQSIAICKEIELLDAWIRFALALSEAYQLSENYKEALTSFREYKKLEDSVFSNDNKLKIAGLETKREADLKEKQMEINRLQESSKKKERLLYIAGIGLLSFSTVQAFRSYRRQQRLTKQKEAANNELIDEKAKLVEEKERSDKLTAELKETIVQKDELTSQLEISAEMKTKFLANISHELRTPITLLTGMLELMRNKESKKDEKREERLEVAYNNSRRLQFMVEEILDLSRLETSAAKLSLETKDIVPVLKRMTYAFETIIEKEYLTLEFTEHNTAGVHISVDEMMLEKVVNNLVYNAIKFNVRGGWLKIDAALSGNGKHFIFSVRNSGSGIKPEDLPHVFDRYYQGDSSTPKAEGVGIGLSLVKEFTLLMGGTVDVRSSQEEGTKFTLHFPVIEAQALPVKDEETWEPPNMAWEHFPDRQTVLVVEDNLEMRYYVREILSGNVNVAEASNGREALAWLERNKADLVISDLMMPEMGGGELIANLKNNEAYKKIPVITLTALADAGSKMNLLRLGIDDYIVKPFYAPELRVRVYNLLNNQEERRQFEQKPAVPDDVPVGNKEADDFRETVVAFVLARMKTIDVSVYDLAYHMNMSERQFYRLAKKLTGCTPAQLIREVKLQKAYELLLGGTIYKLDDVARRVGYEDTAYFSRQFMERFGKRPTELI